MTNEPIQADFVSKATIAKAVASQQEGYEVIELPPVPLEPGEWRGMPTVPDDTAVVGGCE